MHKAIIDLYRNSLKLSKTKIRRFHRRCRISGSTARPASFTCATFAVRSLLVDLPWNELIDGITDAMVETLLPATDQTGAAAETPREFSQSLISPVRDVQG
jgi:hypothetical protein